MRTELVSIATDTIPLDGLFYEPKGKAAGAALLFHGNAMNFYTCAMRFVQCPTLYLRGDQEPRASYPAEDFKARSGGPCTVEIVPDCDHFYNGREEAIQAIVSAWLANTLQLEATR